jgi:aminoglycoside 6'-N-acetyltransferase I
MDELVESYFATGRIDHLEHLVLIARAEGSGGALGFAEVSLRDFAEGCESSPVGYLEGWFVTEPSRRLGVGRALLEAGEAWARARGCVEFASDAETWNEGSIASHGRLGFEEVCRIVCFRKGL